VLLAVAALCTASCALPFYWQAIGGQLELLGKRTPIATLLADPDTDPVLRERLAAVAQIRRFAVAELDLPDNDSYTTYADIGRPYVVWNVVAAEEFSVEPKRWCFPFAGCVAYRGFFERQSAERFQARLTRNGLDTYLGGASAYSTLGYFDDPVLSTMLGGGEQYIASLLFHELAHQKVYVKDDSELNEAFATAVEEYGTEVWLRRRDDEAGLARYRERLKYRADFANLVLAQQARLSRMFVAAAPAEQKRAAKAEAFALMREEYAALKQEWGGITDYDAWFAQPLNNAVLASVATYRRWLPGLRWKLREEGLETFYADVAALETLAPDERSARLESWLHGASCAGRAAESG
jgi:predicted aminopeptidase